MNKCGHKRRSVIGIGFGEIKELLPEGIKTTRLGNRVIHRCNNCKETIINNAGIGEEVEYQPEFPIKGKIVNGQLVIEAKLEDLKK